MRVGLIQTRTPANPAAALAGLEPLIREAARKGASHVFTPEGTNLLQKNRDALFTHLAPPETDVAVQGLIGLARELSIWLLIGSALVRRPDGKAANRSMLISPAGEVTATYDKLHMFDVDLPTGETARESHTYEPGDRAATALAGEAKLGLTICYDMRFPPLYRALALAGAEIITVPAAFTRPTGAAHWEILLRARAIETGSFVLAPAQGGFHEDGRGTYGHSLAIGPWGQILGQLEHDDPGTLVVDLDLSEVAKARRAIPALTHARDFAPPKSIS